MVEFSHASIAFGWLLAIDQSKIRGVMRPHDPIAVFGRSQRHAFGSPRKGGEFGGRSVVIWDPEMVPNDERYGIDGEGFGFDIVSDEPISVLVEATDAIGTTPWVTLATVNVVGGSVRFLDPMWEDFDAQFYRLRMPQ